MDPDENGPHAHELTTHFGEGASAGTLPSGWVPLVKNDWLTELLATGSWIAIGGVVIIAIATNDSLSGLALQWRVVVWLGAVVGVLIAIVLWYRFRPLPKVNFEKNLLRAGLRTVPINKISWALVDSTWKNSRALTLQVGTGTLLDESDFARRTLAMYVVRTIRGETPPVDRARLMAELLRRSSIELPKTPEDPLGDSLVDFTGTVTREQAIDIVLNPPALGHPRPGESVPPSLT